MTLGPNPRCRMGFQASITGILLSNTSTWGTLEPSSRNTTFRPEYTNYLEWYKVPEWEKTPWFLEATPAFGGLHGHKAQPEHTS